MTAPARKPPVLDRRLGGPTAYEIASEALQLAHELSGGSMPSRRPIWCQIHRLCWRSLPRSPR